MYRSEGKERLISIIVPVYNAADYIEETIDCVVAQTWQDWELLLVEDCSKDASLAVIKACYDRLGDSRIRLIPQPANGGAARARNRGLEEASGRYVAFLDADDLWPAVKLERQVAFMEEQGAAFAFTGYEFADERGVGTGRVVRVPETMCYREALKNTTIFTTTVMFDTRRIGREQLKLPLIKSEDTALWWRILRQGYTAYGLNENLALYRRAGRTLSSNKLEALRRIWNLYRRAEGLSIPYSAYNFCFWAIRAVWRRIAPAGRRK